MKISLYEKAKKLRFHAVLLSTLLKSGRFHREFRMRGLSFDSIRDYIPGDDIRFIDWNATARFGKPYVKEFVEDSNVPIMLVIDVSASVTVVKNFFEKIQECALLLLYAGMHQQIPVGLTLFGMQKTDVAPQGVIFIKPEVSRANYHRIEKLLLSCNANASGISNINDALFYVNKRVHPGTLVFILSDYYFSGYKEKIAMLMLLHTVIGIRFLHARNEYPNCVLHSQDAESGNNYLLLANKSYSDNAVKERTMHIESELYAIFNSGFLLEILQEHDVFTHLANFLKERTLR